MNPRIENLRGYILRKEHHVLRRTPARLGLDNLNIGFAAAGMPPVRRSAEMLAAPPRVRTASSTWAVSACPASRA